MYYNVLYNLDYPLKDTKVLSKVLSKSKINKTRWIFSEGPFNCNKFNFKYYF